MIDPLLKQKIISHAQQALNNIQVAIAADENDCEIDFYESIEYATIHNQKLIQAIIDIANLV